MRRGYRDDPKTGDFPGERVFASGVNLRYVMRPATERPDMLVVGFAAAQASDRPARFHGHRLLSELPCHRLFLLDDHGPPELGSGPCWYLGRHRRFDVADSVCELVERTIEELGLERACVATAGSSMGGWAALYFAARLGLGHAIAGEPQTLLGEYMGWEPLLRVAEHIAGGRSDADRRFLDAILFEALRAAPAVPDVHLFCAGGGEYHEIHVRPLVELLVELGTPWDLELGRDFEHGDLGPHYREFLLRRLGELLARTPVPA